MIQQIKIVFLRGKQTLKTIKILIQNLKNEKV